MDRTKKIILIALASVLLIGLIILLNFKLPIIKIDYPQNGTYENNVIVSIKNLLFNYKEDLWCVTAQNNKVKVQDGVCTLSLNPGNYKLSIESDKNTKWVNKTITINTLAAFDIKKEQIYLVTGSSTDLEYRAEKTDITWEYDNTIISFENGKVTGLKDGETTLIGTNPDGVKEYVKITVTSLVQNKTTFDYNKDYIQCQQYTSEEAKILDEFLAYEINEAGYQTRAGVVAAARFLTLAFEYRLPYFFENGRLNGTGVHVIDGEGRYYHKGLYLSTDKYADIGPKKDGPAMWGCMLKNRDNTHGWKLFAPYPNGLDCSGFVAWSLLNGGFDLGDFGSHDKPIYDESKIYGDEFLPVNLTTVNSGKVKPGDIIAIPGHLAIIIGIDEEHFYVAESNVGFKGLVMNTYKKEDLSKKFTYIHLMDNIYKEDGNLTMMW
ncbi:MAG: hypothetical protein E7173_03470 [Firmicutes bacterium]|nr:hypothetical protein [Bacillota bacterium]